MATTWSATNHSPDITLTNGNLTATQNGGSANHAMGKSDTAITTAQKKYWEITVVAVATIWGSGLVDSTAVSFPSGDFLGGFANTLGYYSNGEVYNNFTVIANYATFTTGDVICLAVDFANTKIWWRVNNGNWNNNGTNDPATNTGGLSFGPLFTAGDVNPAYDVFTTSGQNTLNAGALPTAFTPPSGFTTFDDALIPQAVM